MSRNKGSQAQENNQAKAKVMALKNKTQPDHATNDMIDADEYQTSSNPVSDDMVQSRRKAEDFQNKSDK